MANRTRYIVGFTVLCVLAALLLPAMPQPVSYHDFADHREMLGVANFLDVASNVAFVLAGLAGFVVVLRPRTEFASNAERWPYAVFFAGMVLTGLGSAYYHLVPDNERLFWDRLPMTIAFMSLIAAQVVDRIDTKTGLALLVPMLLVGAASVLYWRATERAGAGNVMPYAVLQGYSVVILFLLALLQPSRYTRGSDIYWVFAGYVLAKLLETFDRQLLSLGHVVSGHTLKHLAAAFAGLVVCRMLLAAQPAAAIRRRTPQRRCALMVRAIAAVEQQGAVGRDREVLHAAKRVKEPAFLIHQCRVAHHPCAGHLGNCEPLARKGVGARKPVAGGVAGQAAVRCEVERRLRTGNERCSADLHHVPLGALQQRRGVTATAGQRPVANDDRH